MSVVVVGNFDGVHRGHVKILKKAAEIAKQEKTEAVAFTFREHPQNILHAGYPVKRLIDDAYKEQLIQKTGIHTVNFMTPDKAFLSLSAKDFLVYLQKTCACKTIVCGSNSSFGKGAQADSYTLKELAEPLGITVVVVELENGGISSTNIRRCIEKGEIPQANTLLGYDFSIKAEVIPGKQLGRTLDFPTLNQRIPEGFIVPAFGVYLTYLILDGVKKVSITDVGHRPTVESADSAVLAETHVIGQTFQEDWYGKTLRVYFSDRIRDEKKFSSVEELKTQIWKDCELAKKYL